MIFQIIRFFKTSLLRNPAANWRILILIIAVLCYGTTGFLNFELQGSPNLSWSDGLWYTVVTMTTVGYGDFFPKTAAGRFLVGWPVMFFGIGLLGYALSLIAAALVTAKTKELKGMSSFAVKDHLIIFNYPGLAKIERVLEELYLDPSFDRGKKVILIDEDLSELPPELQKLDIHFVKGNPTRDETLMRAAVDQARHAVVLCKDAGNPASDNINISITLAIEGRSRKVNTVVECVDPSSEELLRKAGCDRIVCTSRFGANFLTQELLNPGVQEVIDDLLSSKKGQQIYFIPVEAPSRFKDIADTCRGKGHIALGICNPNGIHLNPPMELPVAADAKIITIGPERLKSLKC